MLTDKDHGMCDIVNEDKWEGYRSSKIKFYKTPRTPCHYCGRQTFGRNESRQGADVNQFRSLDHKHPRSHGGQNDESNWACACARCNSVKGDIPYDLFVEFCAFAFPMAIGFSVGKTRRLFWTWISEKLSYADKTPS